MYSLGQFHQANVKHDEELHSKWKNPQLNQLSAPWYRNSCQPQARPGLSGKFMVFTAPPPVWSCSNPCRQDHQTPPLSRQRKARPLLSASHRDTHTHTRLKDQVSLVAGAPMIGFALIWTCLRFYQYLEGERINSIHGWWVSVGLMLLPSYMPRWCCNFWVIYQSHLMVWTPCEKQRKLASVYLSRGSGVMYFWAKAVTESSLLLRLTVNLAARGEGRWKRQQGRFGIFQQQHTYTHTHCYTWLHFIKADQTSWFFF